MNRFFSAWALVLGCLVLAAPASEARTCGKPFTEVFGKVGPSVVRIHAIVIDPFSAINRIRMGVGSGVVIDDRGNVVTNAHVVYGARHIAISVDPDGGSMLPAELVGLDPITDLAVIRSSDRRAPLSRATLGSTKDLQVGEEVMAVGYPLGMGITATQGIISATGRVIPVSPMSWLTPMLQTNAALSPGNSGGALVDLCGEVVGINTVVAPVGQNNNFAIPIDIVHDIVAQIVAKGRVIRPWHGIHGRLVPPMLSLTLGIPPGFMVETIEPGSPAEKIGLRGGGLPVAVGTDQFLLGGDVIAEVNGHPMTDLETVIRIAKGLKVGDTVKILYRRGAQVLRGEVVLPERPMLPGDAQRFLYQRPSGSGN